MVNQNNTPTKRRPRRMSSANGRGLLVLPRTTRSCVRIGGRVEDPRAACSTQHMPHHVSDISVYGCVYGSVAEGGGRGVASRLRLEGRVYSILS